MNGEASKDTGNLPDPSFPAWSHSVSECLDSYHVTIEKGLTDGEIARRRAIYGSNELEKEPGTPFWKLVLQQFDDTLVKILLAAAAISFVLAYTDGQVREYIKRLTMR